MNPVDLVLFLVNFKHVLETTVVGISTWRSISSRAERSYKTIPTTISVWICQEAFEFWKMNHDTVQLVNWLAYTLSTSIYFKHFSPAAKIYTVM